MIRNIRTMSGAFSYSVRLGQDPDVCISKNFPKLHCVSLAKNHWSQFIKKL